MNLNLTYCISIGLLIFLIVMYFINNNYKEFYHGYYNVNRNYDNRFWYPIQYRYRYIPRRRWFYFPNWNWNWSWNRIPTATEINNPPPRYYPRYYY
jgi:hypothetical protein